MSDDLWGSLKSRSILGFTVKEFERDAGLSHASVYNLIRTGKLETIKIGGKRLIPHDSVDKMIEAARVASTPLRGRR